MNKTKIKNPQIKNLFLHVEKFFDFLTIFEKNIDL